MTVSLPNKAIVLKVGQFSEVEEDDCAICLVALKEGNQKVISLACSHFFHLKCMKGWAEAVSDRVAGSQNEQAGRVSCPMCRDSNGLSGRFVNNMTRLHRWRSIARRVAGFSAYILVHAAEIGTVGVASERIINYPSRAENGEDANVKVFVPLVGTLLGLGYLAFYLFHLIRRSDEESRPLPPIVHYSGQLYEGVSDCFQFNITRVHPEESGIEEV